MIPLEELKEFGPVAIVVPSSTVPRFMLFEMSLESLYVPPFSQLYRVSSASPAKNRNDGIRMGLQHQLDDQGKPVPRMTHWLFLDDDQHFDSWLLVRMLKKQVPVICALTCLARPPFLPVIFKGETYVNGDDWSAALAELVALGQKYHVSGDERSRLNQDLRRLNHRLGIKRYEAVSWSEIDGKHGAYPVFAGAGSGLLVEREVIEKMPQPWFEVGQYDPEQLQEDVVFYEKCRDLGVPIYCDLDSPMGHFASVGSWPVRTEDDRWTVNLMWENGKQFRLGRSDGAGWPGGVPPKEKLLER